VGSLDGRWVQRNDAHNVAESQSLAAEGEGGARLHQAIVGVEEEFSGIEAGLAVDLDGANGRRTFVSLSITFARIV
jgi:hypothetical protein